MIGKNIPAPPAAEGIGGSTGSVDNAILRADGTGGYTLQNSGLVVNDSVATFAITGDASTDYITAVGNNFTNNQCVMFLTLTGGSGLYTQSIFFNAWYFVRDIGGAGAGTFRVSLTSGPGAAENFTTNITAGTIVAMQPSVAITPSGTYSNISLVLQPKGTGALIAATPTGDATGGRQRGAGAVDLQLVRNNANQVAMSPSSALIAGTRNAITDSSAPESAIVGGFECSLAGGQASFLGGGYQNKIITGAANLSAIVGGGTNEIQQRDSFIGAGRFSLINAQCAAIVGGGESGVGNEITAQSGGILAGVGAKSDRRAMHAHAAGRFAANGDAQRARFVLRCKTTTNTAVEMALNGSTTYLGIPSGKVIACTINISGVKSDGSAVAHYVRQYAVKNVGGTSSEVYAPVTIGTDNAAGTTIALSANNGDDTLRIAVTGIAAETWRWVASVDAVEIAYGT